MSQHFRTEVTLSGSPGVRETFEMPGPATFSSLVSHFSPPSLFFPTQQNSPSTPATTLTPFHFFECTTLSLTSKPLHRPFYCPVIFPPQVILLHSSGFGPQVNTYRRLPNYSSPGRCLFFVPIHTLISTIELTTRSDGNSLFVIPTKW